MFDISILALFCSVMNLSFKIFQYVSNNCICKSDNTIGLTIGDQYLLEAAFNNAIDKSRSEETNVVGDEDSAFVELV